MSGGGLERIAQAIQEKLDAYSLYLRDTNDRSQDHFHPSTIGFCPRRTVMERLRVKKPPHDVKLQRVFDNGHYVHERIQHELKESGIMVLAEVPVAAPEHNMSGHTDGIGQIYIDGIGGVMVILEIKSASKKSYEWIAGGGEKRYSSHGPDKKHQWQVQLYMYMTGINYAVIIYENKNDQTRSYFVIKKDNDLIKNILLPRVDLINDCVNKGVLPPRDEEHKDPQPDGKTPFECQYCDYVRPCRAEELHSAEAKEGIIDLIELGEKVYNS